MLNYVLCIVDATGDDVFRYVYNNCEYFNMNFFTFNIG